MDLPKGKENRGFQAPFSAFSPKFDVLCNSMIECQDTSFPFRPDATFLPKNLLKKRKHHVLLTFEHVSKDPFLPISSRNKHTIIGQAPSIETWNLALSGRRSPPFSSEPRQPIRRLHGTEASPEAIRVWRCMRVSWIFQVQCRSRAWRTVQISAYYLRFVYVKVRKIRETTKASSLYLPPHPFISLDAERHIFRDS